MPRAGFVSALVLGLATQAAGADDGKGVKETEGSWKPISAELAGEPFPDEVLKTIKLVVKDGKYVVQVGGQNDEGTVSYDPTKSPKTMDIKGTKGPNEGKTFLCIYEIVGNEMRVCYDLSGKSRPTQFATKPETTLYLVRYRREQQ